MNIVDKKYLQSVAILLGTGAGLAFIGIGLLNAVMKMEQKKCEATGIEKTVCPTQTKSADSSATRRVPNVEQQAIQKDNILYDSKPITYCSQNTQNSYSNQSTERISFTAIKNRIYSHMKQHERG